METTYQIFKYVLFVFVSVKCVSMQSYMLYRLVPDFNDFVARGNAIATFDVMQYENCVSRCFNKLGCESFFHNDIRKTCRLLSDIFLSRAESESDPEHMKYSFLTWEM